MEEEPEMVDSLVFELNNLKKSDVFSGISREMCSFSADDYARKIETLEYETTFDTHDIQQECVQSGIWPENFVTYPEFFESEWSSLDSYLKHRDADMHTDFYRLSWYENCASPEKALSFQLEMIAKSKQIIDELEAAGEGI